jgi:lipopolysaccharide transport system ATP-binding protein
MGFHSDFTGRQNVYMAGQLLGYSVEEIAELMPQIEAFAEIGDYIDQPVRVYSSGMQMRLAFSVATARRPDVLIVDEALSVGDAHFQHKSFDRIREFRKLDTTLLIVSHDKQAIQSICDHAILLNGGKLAMQDEPEAVMDYYNALLADHQNQIITQKTLFDGKQRVDSGTFEAEVKSVELLDESGQRLEVVTVGQKVTAIVEVKVNSDIKGLVLGFGVKDQFGQMIFGTNTFHTKQKLSAAYAGEEITFRVDFCARLGVGSYSIHCSLVENDTHVEKNYHWIDRAKVFEMVNIDKPHFVGCAWNELNFQIVRR